MQHIQQPVNSPNPTFLELTSDAIHCAQGPRLLICSVTQTAPNTAKYVSVVSGVTLDH